jgi:outer membrane protein
MFLSPLNCLRPLKLLPASFALLLTIASAALQAQQPAAPSSQSTPVQASTPATPLPVASESIHMKDYSRPNSSFPNLLHPYQVQDLPQANLGNTARMDSLMRDGKIYLSIDDAVALALENNLDLEIARYNLNIAETDLLRAKSGANILGINAGIVQNTPGGGVGGLGGTVGSGTGGTTVAASGAGTGTNGLVSSTLGIGAPITPFDPQVTSTLQLDKDDTISTSTISPAPGGIIAQNTYTANFAYMQGFQWGTALSAGFNNSHLTTDSSVGLLSPQIVSNFQFRVTQNLLQGFGSLANTRFIRIAKNNREISDVAFRLQIITTVDQIEDMYWDLVYAFENVRVQQEALTYAQKALSDSKQQAQVGTAPPIQVVSAQSTVETDQQNLILAQNNLQLEELLMKNAVSRSIEDPILAEADVIPTSTMQLPAQEPVIPTQDMITQALQHRAELIESRIDLNSRDLSAKAVRNDLLPSLQAFAYYGGSGLAGNLNPLCTQLANTTGTSTACTQPPVFGSATSAGYTSALHEMVNSTAPDKGVGLSLSIPIRNRLAQANQVRADLEYRQAQVRLQQLENQVRIEVRNAQFDVKQNRAAVEAAQAAVTFARQTIDADQQKLKVGLTTQTAILQDASTLTTSESNLVSAKAAYEKSRIELDRATGLLLDHANIDVADATRGQTRHLPSVPYVAPRPDPATAPSSAPQSTQQPQGGQL